MILIWLQVPLSHYEYRSSLLVLIELSTFEHQIKPEKAVFMTSSKELLFCLGYFRVWLARIESENLEVFFMSNSYFLTRIHIQLNSVITNSTGPSIFVSYNCEALCSKLCIWDRIILQNFVRYNREFVTTVIVITQFDCIQLKSYFMVEPFFSISILSMLSQSMLLSYHFSLKCTAFVRSNGKEEKNF